MLNAHLLPVEGIRVKGQARKKRVYTRLWVLKSLQAEFNAAPLTWNWTHALYNLLVYGEAQGLAGRRQPVWPGQNPGKYFRILVAVAWCNTYSALND